MWCIRGLNWCCTFSPLLQRQWAIANVSKTLNETQRRYSQIYREAFAVIFALRRFHQFLYGRHFVFGHEPQASIGTVWTKQRETPLLAANRLARWALLLRQYHYSVEFWKTQKHGNANALSSLPVGGDLQFDGEEVDDYVDNVYTIHMISHQMVQDYPRLLIKETSKIKSSLKSCTVWRNDGQTNVQMSYRATRTWKPLYPKNMDPCTDWEW